MASQQVPQEQPARARCVHGRLWTAPQVAPMHECVQLASTGGYGDGDGGDVRMTVGVGGGEEETTGRSQPPLGVLLVTTESVGGFVRSSRRLWHSNFL